MLKKVIQSVMFLSIIIVMSGASAEIINPSAGNKTRSMETNYPSWQYPVTQTVEVNASKLPALREEDLVGSYQQPLWTAARRFPTTRVYILPESKIDAEYWNRTTYNKDGTRDYRNMYEVEFGLPHRFQVDIYYRTDESSKDDIVHPSEQYEMRYAFADWGKLPGNPTVYFEFIRHHDEPNQIEPKLLLGGDFEQMWHWAVNFVAECQTSGDLEREYQVCNGLSYTLLDYKLAVGVEGREVFTDAKQDRGSFTTEIVLGPSFQYRPITHCYVNFAPLVGVTDESPDAQLWLNAGYEF